MKLLIKSRNILGLLWVLGSWWVLGCGAKKGTSSSESARNLGVEIAISSRFLFFFQGVAH